MAVRLQYSGTFHGLTALLINLNYLRTRLSFNYSCSSSNRLLKLFPSPIYLFNIDIIAYRAFSSWLEKRPLFIAFVFEICLTLYSGKRKFYDLLEVTPDASEPDLKKAYRKKLVCSICLVWWDWTVLLQGSTSAPRQRRRPRALQRSNTCVSSLLYEIFMTNIKFCV